MVKVLWRASAERAHAAVYIAPFVPHFQQSPSDIFDPKINQPLRGKQHRYTSVRPLTMVLSFEPPTVVTGFAGVTGTGADFPPSKGPPSPMVRRRSTVSS